MTILKNLLSRGSAVAAGAAVVVGAAIATAPAASADISYSIQNAHSNKCLGIWMGTGVDAIQWGCNYNPDQRWSFEDAGNGYRHIKNAYGKCLGIQGGVNWKGESAVQWSCNGNSDQLWKYDYQGSGKFRLINANSGMCLGVWKGGVKDGDDVMQWPCNGNSDQLWYNG
ncbi:RICIN domain-containing protein [Streptomyces orinoci]|uniref:RICIN domain-containing protein n=1 Tax=Streptomyces orinoci TaxID=67339 RepID=A0ABV3JRM8_STRON|nr:RICIN domain-containing protein [Streptomyces orinoci]